MFAFYLQSFSTVEVNSSFYHLPLRKTFENWRAASPDNFIFALKASRFITHVKRLNDAESALQKFFENAGGLEEKMGPVLFQLPPGFKINTGRLSVFLGQLPRGGRYTFEFRNMSWFNNEVYALLREYGAAFCAYELGETVSPLEVTADFAYVRLHGPAGKYRGSYSKQELEKWYGTLDGWARDSVDVYCYFDNDERGFAAINALELQELVGSS